MNSNGKQSLAGVSYFTNRTTFSPGTCLSTDSVSSVNRTTSDGEKGGKRSQNNISAESFKTKIQNKNLSSLRLAQATRHLLRGRNEKLKQNTAIANDLFVLYGKS